MKLPPHPNPKKKRRIFASRGIRGLGLFKFPIKLPLNSAWLGFENPQLILTSGWGLCCQLAWHQTFDGYGLGLSCWPARYQNLYGWDQLNQLPLSSMVECGRDLTKSNEIWQISNCEEWQRATNGGTAMDDKESDKLVRVGFLDGKPISPIWSCFDGVRPLLPTSGLTVLSSLDVGWTILFVTNMHECRLANAND